MEVTLKLNVYSSHTNSFQRKKQAVIKQSVKTNSSGKRDIQQQTNQNKNTQVESKAEVKNADLQKTM